MHVVNRIEAIYLAILRLAFLLAATIALVSAVALAIAALLGLLARAPAPSEAVVPNLTVDDYNASRATQISEAATAPKQQGSSAFDQFEKQSAAKICDDENAILATVGLELSHGLAECQQARISFAHQKFSSSADLRIYWNTIVPLWNSTKQSPATLRLTEMHGGVGISFSIDENAKNVLVDSVIPGSPADRAGVRSKDRITAIDGQQIKAVVIGIPGDMQASRVGNLLGGDPDTRVVLTVSRDGTVLPITIIRKEIPREATTAAASAHVDDVFDSFESWQVTQVQKAISERQIADTDAQSAYAERKSQVGPKLYAAAISAGLFMFISFIFLAIRIEGDVRTIAQQSSIQPRKTE